MLFSGNSNARFPLRARKYLDLGDQPSVTAYERHLDQWIEHLDDIKRSKKKEQKKKRKRKERRQTWLIRRNCALYRFWGSAGGGRSIAATLRASRATTRSSKRRSEAIRRKEALLQSKRVIGLNQSQQNQYQDASDCLRASSSQTAFTRSLRSS